MTDIETVRLLIGDRKKVVTREVVASTNDGVQLTFQTDMYPWASGAGGGDGTGNMVLWTSGIELTETATTTFSGKVGVVLLASAITAGAKIEASYYYHALTSGELSDILSGHTGSPYLVAANACLILAADATRLFMYTMGEKMVDKRRVASDLMKLSASLESRHYKKRDDEGFTAGQWAFHDETGTPYDNYDTAVAFYASGSG